MKIAVLIFPNLTALDAIGPVEVLSRLPETQILMVAPEKSICRTGRTSGQYGLCADYSIEEVEQADILLIPGGGGVREIIHDQKTLDWVAHLHKNTIWTTSVCTGALVLGAAGLLKNLHATTHWKFMEYLSKFGALPTTERMVFEGKIVTAAGVSAGIDMALRLSARIAGEDYAQAIQWQIEYDPLPPFPVNSSKNASPGVWEILKTM